MSQQDSDNEGADIARAAADVSVADLHEKNAEDAALEREVEASQPTISQQQQEHTANEDDVEDDKADLYDADERNRGARAELTSAVDAAAETVAAAAAGADAGAGAGEGDAADSDDESVLSDVDEEQFQDFDPANVEIDDRPQLAIDEENLKLIGRHKRARNEDGEYVEKKKRRKEGRREKRSRKKRAEVVEEGGEVVIGGDEYEDEAGEPRRRRKTAAAGGATSGGRRRRRQVEEEVDLEALDEPTRRRIELDRLMDQSLKKPVKRRARKDDIDLVDLADAQIEDMRRRMTDAARLDSEAKKAGKPVFHKVKMLSDVVSLLNKTQYINSLVDPEINLLEAVKFFLEPLDDGSLPAYEIRSKLMACLQKLPMNKDALVASGIGKVILLYTKSKFVEEHIKRQAEKLLADWTRLILQRSDDYSKRVYQTAEFDPTKLQRPPPAVSVAATAAEARSTELLPPRLANRARADAGPKSYTIVPKPIMVKETKFSRPLGAAAEEKWRKLKTRTAKRK
ncbi:Transcription factor iws1 [Ascosphaera acerosa]|nr:Transcription factor iws1 [Ascosphaera acerosa]